MSEAIKARPGSGRARRNEEMQYRLLLAVSFVVFLLGALIARLSPSHWRSRKSERRSIIEEARAAARTAIPYAFMS
ncbi:hypothetical protein CKO15_07935 [Halorhodospira abdelmalekii]|uniref:hypothetical protein n=1 Tax=Halorhodospira abdelmalekii TaxID=421629 RepID=UPI001906D678|nr:hypothetical protein [Halorhodospira abdelmalekii]MBK1735215.1 hypothetical protein [Halorhodospira abdelmalekii]